MTAFTINLNPIISLSDEQFYQLCRQNPELKFERNAQGDLIIMPPTGGETGNRNAGIVALLWLWNQQTKLGVTFDSSTGFKLPNGANRSPDAAWVRLERWNLLTTEQKEKFPPLCPDFVVELLSPNDQLKDVQKKMQEYLENGTQLGWLIHRKAQQVEIYRPGIDVEVLENPNEISGEPVLSGFILNLERIW
jgi:Uma2 family endonuclease